MNEIMTIYNEFERDKSRIQEPNQTASEILRKYWIFSIDNPETQKLCIIQAILEYADQGGQKEPEINESVSSFNSNDPNVFDNVFQAGK